MLGGCVVVEVLLFVVVLSLLIVLNLFVLKFMMVFSVGLVDRICVWLSLLVCSMWDCVLWVVCRRSELLLGMCWLFWLCIMRSCVFLGSG